jgi:hypothetical protein
MLTRKLFPVPVYLNLTSGFSFSQNYNWMTQNHTYLKMHVADDCIYGINKSSFTDAGINISLINPEIIKVNNKGFQVHVYPFDEQDGTFEVNDYSGSNLLLTDTVSSVLKIAGTKTYSSGFEASSGNKRILNAGKDIDGDYVANGTYFYKLITHDESTKSNLTEPQVQKLVVLK